MSERVTMPADFGFGDDEAMLRDQARKLLREEWPIDKLRRLVAADPDAVYERGERPAWDESLWRKIVDLGWTGLAVPEEHGGAGGKLVGVAALVEEAGRVALPSPLLATLASTYVLRAAATPASAPWLRRIASGEAMTLACADADGDWTGASTGVRARDAGGQVVLSGEAHFVQDAFKCDSLLVAARYGDEVWWCVVSPSAPGVELVQEHIVDLTRDQATLRCHDVHVAVDAIVCRDAVASLARAWPALLVLVSADLCGAGEWQLQTTVEYARTRVQFDRPIGFFQAVKHPLVNGMVDLDRARSLLYHAACCVDGGSPEAEVAARMAKSAAADAGAFLSDRSVQLHGGIGFTWECDVHLYFKRSLHDQALFGDAVEQRRQLAELLIGPVA